MSDISGQVGELRFTVEVTRASTGKTEVVELIGAIDAKDLDKLQEANHGSNS